MELDVTPAQVGDVDSVAALLDEAAAWQQGLGVDMWRPGTFVAEIRDVISAGNLFVARLDDAVVGCFMLEAACPEWMAVWLVEHGWSPGEAMYLGRLAVAREASGRGLGAELLDSARTLAADDGFAFVRLNCRAENEGLRRYYLDAGFVDLGAARLIGPNAEEWVCSVCESALPSIDTDSPGLRLTRLGPGQVDEYFQLVDRNRAHVTRHGDYVELGEATHDSVLADLQSDPDSAPRFGIRLRGKLIGRVDVVPRDPGNFVLGYWLDEAHKGHGYITSACRAAIEQVAQEPTPTIWAGVTKGNESSARVLERLGFEPMQDLGSYVRYRRRLK